MNQLVPWLPAPPAVPITPGAHAQPHCGHGRVSVRSLAIRPIRGRAGITRDSKPLRARRGLGAGALTLPANRRSLGARTDAPIGAELLCGRARSAMLAVTVTLTLLQM